MSPSSAGDCRTRGLGKAVHIHIAYKLTTTLVNSEFLPCASERKHFLGMRVVIEILFEGRGEIKLLCVLGTMVRAHQVALKQQKKTSQLKFYLCILDR